MFVRPYRSPTPPPPLPLPSNAIHGSMFTPLFSAGCRLGDERLMVGARADRRYTFVNIESGTTVKQNHTVALDLMQVRNLRDALNKLLDDAAPPAPPKKRTSIVVSRKGDKLEHVGNPTGYPDATAAINDARTMASRRGGDFLVLEAMSAITAPAPTVTITAL